MHVNQEQVVVREKFRGTSKERLYVKQHERIDVILINHAKFTSVGMWITRIFLPQGYPDSVSKDYLAYQIWDTAQAFCSTISGILATQEVLRGVGVGDKEATPLAATITWVVKDGCGHIGRILFAYSHGTYLDAYSKKWRMYADILNNAAMCIEIALPLFKVYTSFALCVSTVMKAIVGIAGGATRVAMTQHHAIKGNLGDVSAKDSAQETAVNLIASLTSLLIITTIGNNLLVFMLMMILHVMFNYFAVRAVCLRTLNEPRFLLVIEKYLKQELIVNPCEINRIEPIIFYQMGSCILDLKLYGFKIKLGHSLREALRGSVKESHLSKLIYIYRDRNYVLVPRIDSRYMYILLKDKASVDDTLCAYFHAVLLSVITCAINGEPSPIYDKKETRPFAKLCHTLQSVDWSRNEPRIPRSKSTYTPSYDLFKYLDNIVQKEWPKMRTGLIHTGWDLTKHLLITDQWCLSSPMVTPSSHPAEKSNEFQIPTESVTRPVYSFHKDELSSERCPTKTSAKSSKRKQHIQ